MAKTNKWYIRGVFFLWVSGFLAPAAVLAWRLASWRIHYGSFSAALEAELLGLLPLLMLFGPPLVALFFLWRWLRT